jgi:hypothetical protein
MNEAPGVGDDDIAIADKLLLLQPATWLQGPCPRFLLPPSDLVRLLAAAAAAAA